jgi:hypothetical protein
MRSSSDVAERRSVRLYHKTCNGYADHIQHTPPISDGQVAISNSLGITVTHLQPTKVAGTFVSRLIPAKEATRPVELSHRGKCLSSPCFARTKGPAT